LAANAREVGSHACDEAYVAERNEVHGAGTARVEDDRLVFTLMYHQGDDYTYEGTRRS
jgi:hypothetical protein